MERKGTNKEVFRWQKKEGGSLHLTINGRRCIIKPGQIFTATEDEVPLAFRDVVIKLDGMSIQEQTKEISGVVPVYEKQQLDTVNVISDKGRTIRKDVSLEEAEEILKDHPLYVVQKKFNVVTKKGKVINEIPLSEEEADELIKVLTE